ncbi:GntR family transcriptional regulator [Paenibacillus cisolokensis]|uniref:GntR family transcriptional regulator n=2 Tax=Paenibacillus cisolokensis TaxID=1658519 RepID=A0ABQ4N556_9BACL|nr:GntR family transcriptional regulator [Paenibacillus cisolokensis]
MNILISNSSDEPIYLQIVNQIKEQIMKGELTDSEPLPSIRSLAKDLNISVITTKRAYDELEKEGFIVTVAGKGSFVASINNEMLREAKIRVIEEK